MASSTTPSDLVLKECVTWFVGPEEILELYRHVGVWAQEAGWRGRGSIATSKIILAWTDKHDSMNFCNTGLVEARGFVFMPSGYFKEVTNNGREHLPWARLLAGRKYLRIFLLERVAPILSHFPDWEILIYPKHGTIILTNATVGNGIAVALRIPFLTGAVNLWLRWLTLGLTSLSYQELFERDLVHDPE